MPTLTGTSANDTITPSTVSSGVTGGTPGAGADSILGLGGSDLLDGGGGDDTILGGDGDDTLTGAAGDDSLNGGAGDDRFLGSAGNDTIAGGDTGGNILDYASLGQAVSVTWGTSLGGASGNAVVKGGGLGTDSFQDVRTIGGSGLADTMTVGFTNQPSTFLFLFGGGGADTLDGNNINNVWADYDSGTASAVTADLAAGNATWLRATDTLIDVVSIRTDDADDTVFGSAASNRFRLGLGTNTVDGRDGTDRLFAASGGPVTITHTGAGTGTMTVAGGSNSVTSFTNVEVLFTREGADSLTGSSGDDFMGPGGGNDRVDGGAGYDYVSYNYTYGFGTPTGVTVNLALGTATDNYGGTDTLLGIEAAEGTSFADDLTGTTASGASRSMLRGREGADILRAATTGTLITADYQDGSTAGINANLSNAANRFVVDGFGATDTLINITSIRGSDGADTMLGGAVGERFDGDDGNDSLAGAGGNDRLQGQAGNDTLLGGEGDDTLEPGTGANAVNGGAGFDTMVSGDLGAASFVLTAPGAGTLTVSLAAGGTATTTFEGIEYFVGGAGADSFTGSSATDYFAPLGGNDVNLDGGGGFDWLTYRYDTPNPTAGAVVNFATGTATDGLGGNDTFVRFEAVSGTELADQLTGAVLGGVGVRLRGNEGADTIRGVAGDATIVADYRNASQPGTGGIVAHLTDAANLTVVDSFGDTDRLFDIRNVSGSDFGDSMSGGAAGEVLTGLLGADTLLGGAGADTLAGGEDDDVLVVGAGDDVVDGGDGFDTLDLSDATGGITLSLALTGIQTLRANQGRDIITGVEEVVGSLFADAIAGSAVAELLRGNDGNDRLSGLEGDDTLLGGGGADRLDGGTGADVLFGGAGDDTYVVDDAGDEVSEQTAPGVDDGGTDLVSASVSHTLGAGLERLTLLGTANLSATGNGLGNLIRGNDGANLVSGLGGGDSLDGGRGDDTVEGGEGDDLLLGNAGADRFDGGNGLDTLDFSVFVARAVVYLDGTDEAGVARANAAAALGDTIIGVESLFGSATAGDVLTGDAADNRLSGGGGADRLSGKAGVDRIDGGAGEDTLLGGAGADLLTGGTESDLFVFDAAPVAGVVDRIADFEAGLDGLVFSRAAFGLPSGATALALVVGAVPAPTGAGPVLLYDDAGPGIGTLSFDADGTGAGAAIIIARLLNGAALAQADVTLIA